MRTYFAQAVCVNPHPWREGGGSATEGVAVDVATLAGGVDSSVEGGVDSTMEGGVDSAVEVEVDSAVEGGVDSTMEGGVDSAVEGEVDSAVEVEVDSAVEGGVDSTMEGGVDSAVEGGVDSAVEGEVDSAVEGGAEEVADSTTGQVDIEPRYACGVTTYGQGLTNGNSDRRRERVIMPIGYRRLQELCEKDPKEVVLTLVERTSGCKELLDETTIRKDLVALLLHVLARACDCLSSPENTMKLMVMVRNSKFLTRALTTYFAAMPTDLTDHRKLHFREPIKHALRVFRELMDRSPSSYIQVVAPLAVLGTTINTLRIVSAVVDDDLERRLEEVESRKDAIIDLKRKGAVLKDDDGTLATGIQLETPPDDFRKLTVIPTFEDIHTNKEPFLRPNIVRGRYPDVNTYLDVQFRLLREDFIRPLREGIAEFLDIRTCGLGHDRRLQDIRVYHDVHVVHPICTTSGIIYRMQFDAARLRGVRWRSTKRLIFGSLLCLSKDEFKTMFFATVAERDEKELQQGCVQIRFEQNHEDASAISPTDKFIMVETSAYFEAYRHVLKGLQEVKEDTMPFTKYIVDCDCANGVDPPAYLQGRYGEVNYDLRALVETPTDMSEVMVRRPASARPWFMYMAGSDVEESDDSDDGKDAADLNDSNNPQLAKARSVPILREDMWPSADALHLDESQYRAVKMALTKEFSVIQGPPGTGKTYIGLKIVQALLENKNVWMRNQDLMNSPTRPILVVCYTNHALDQFLEGISEFHPKDIVRVGGQSRSEKMEQFNLKTIKFSHRMSRDVPRYIHEGASEARDDMEDLRQDMEMAVAQMMATQRGLLHEHALTPLMNDKHRESLMNMPLMVNDYRWARVGEKSGSVIVQWLGLKGNVFILPGGDKQNQHEEEEEMGEEEEEEEINVMEEAELAEQHRRLDNDNDQRGKAKRKVREYVHVDLALDVEALELEEHQARQYGQWLVQTNAKKRKQKVKHELSKTDMMTDAEVRCIQNVWTLQLQNRWRLYRYWVAKYCAKLKESIREYERGYARAAKRLMEFQSQEDGEIMKKTTVIGMTTTGAARYRSVLQDIRPAIIVVEEAAEVLEAHIVTTLSQQCQHLILIGDHQQLRPNPTVYQLAKKYNMDISLFERMVKNDMQCQRLQSQHRMRPEFARLLTPHIYESLDNHESVLNFENIKGVSSNMFFVDHGYSEAHDSDTKSRSNMHEAQFMASFCRYLLQQGYSPSQITILTTYTGQLFNFKNVMKHPVFKGVRVSAVDNFQGEENDIILLSLVRSNDEGNVGFLKIIQELREQSCVGRHLMLCCQNHPDTSIMAVTEKDFEKAPAGGCMRPCDFRLTCGHVCASACHPTDPEHEEYMCKKPCGNFLCDLGHKCPKFCYETCDDCQVLVEKTIPKCQHKQMVPCSTSPTEFICRIPCEKTLPCNHTCKNMCGQECSIPCMLKVTHQLTCGHTMKAACSAKDDDLVCMEEITHQLTCGHNIQAVCSAKEDDLACMEEITHQLICGHTMKAACSAKENDLVCMEEMTHQLTCGHTMKAACSAKENDLVCMEEKIHQLTCGHSIQAACSAKGNDLVCNTLCTQLLKCEHPCAGTCGRCKQGRLHQQCTHHCNRVLVCSHQCTAPCTQDCPPCTKPCENRCVHSRCPHQCGKPCVPCQKPCQWRCRHHKCDKPCSEPCDRPRCDQPCEKTRRCDKCKKDQPCIGMCGEPCPDKCRLCDREELTKTFFGTEEEDDARFVQLEDCGHVLEVRELDEWMDTSDRKIQLETCPKCKTPIRHNVRYGKSIKRMLVMIEMSKTRQQYVQKAQRSREATASRLLLIDLRSDINLRRYCADSLIDLRQQVERCRLPLTGQVAMFEKKVLFLKKIAKRKKDMKENLSTLIEDKRHITELEKEIAGLENWLLRRTANVSDQEWEEFGREMTRLKSLLKLRILQKQIREIGISLDDLAQAKLASAQRRLTGVKPFTEKREELVKQALEDVKKETLRYSALEGAVARSADASWSTLPPFSTIYGRSEARRKVRPDLAKVYGLEFDDLN
ncbi:ZNFX1 [Branchiostoma lanceolatum]|uniref:ZNFX1 protein n=1 Tax=Branchiostoma lanceolatum TaxID=7740 RepID=A0A8K0A493_BRALA|nr:ZNFX1 [Branchiostoma lanceolatum]